MKIQKEHSFLCISPQVYLYLALLLLILPIRWIGACIASGIVHELGHIAAVKLLGIPLEKIQVEVNGTVIETGPMNTAQEIICALAGPAAGLILSLTMRKFPAVALCALGQTAYNLIPIVPFDGGRAVQCALSALLPMHIASKALHYVAIVFIVVLFIGTLILTIKSIAGLLPFTAFALIAGKCLHQKNSLQR